MTSYIGTLSFKHHEVAARLAKDPVVALAKAYEKQWSANELERQLTERPDQKPFSIPDAVAKILKQIESWPEEQQTPEIVQEVLAQGFDLFIARGTPQLTPRERHTLRWIQAEMESIEFTRHTFNETVGRTVSFDVVGGGAGAPIYQEIISTGIRPTRQQVIEALDHLLAGKVTALGRGVSVVARDLADGTPPARGLMRLPPEAGGDVSGTLFEGLVSPAENLPAFVNELIPDDSDPMGITT